KFSGKLCSGAVYIGLKSNIPVKLLNGTLKIFLNNIYFRCYSFTTTFQLTELRKLNINPRHTSHPPFHRNSPTDKIFLSDGDYRFFALIIRKFYLAPELSGYLHAPLLHNSQQP